MRQPKFILTAWILASILTGCSRMLPETNTKQNEAIGFLLTPRSMCNLSGLTFFGTDTACDSITATGSGWLIAPSDSASVLSLQLSFALSTDGEISVYGAGDRANLSRTAARFDFTTAGSSAFHFDSNIGADIGYAAGTDTVTYCLEIDSTEIPPLLLAKDSPCPSGTSSISDATFNSADAGVPGSSAAPGTAWGLRLTNAHLQWIAVNPSRIFNP